MERWQGERVKTARRKLEEFIERGHKEIARIEAQIAEAEKARRTLCAIEDFR